MDTIYIFKVCARSVDTFLQKKAFFWGCRYLHQYLEFCIEVFLKVNLEFEICRLRGSFLLDFHFEIYFFDHKHVIIKFFRKKSENLRNIALWRRVEALENWSNR